MLRSRFIWTSGAKHHGKVSPYPVVEGNVDSERLYFLSLCPSVVRTVGSRQEPLLPTPPTFYP